MKANNTTKLIIAVLLTILCVGVIFFVSFKNSKEDKAEQDKVVAAENNSVAISLTEEEMENLTTHDDSEVVNHVLVENLSTLQVFDPPVNMVGNLSSYLWLWLKYYTGDNEKQWEVVIDGASYRTEEDTITFDVFIKDNPEEIINCIYYTKQDYYDFYNSTIMAEKDQEN